MAQHFTAIEGFGARRDWLEQLLAGGRIDPAQLDDARTALGLTPTPHQWGALIGAAMAVSGLLLLAAALIFAVAFNWDALGHFARFALVQTMLMLFVAGAWWRGVHTVAGEAALFAACLTCGALLALFGQTYQTGADPYSLFTTWAALILPWLLYARRASLWLLWIVVVNTGLGLYCQQVLGEWGWVRLFGQFETAAALDIVVNGALLVLFERFRTLGGAGLGRAVPRVLAVLLLSGVAAILIPMLGWRSNLHGTPSSVALTALVAIAAFVGVAFYYLKWRRDVLILSAASLCAVGVGYVLLLRVLAYGDAFGLFMFGAAYWVGAIAAVVVWLRGLKVDVDSHDASSDTTVRRTSEDE